MKLLRRTIGTIIVASVFLTAAIVAPVPAMASDGLFAPAAQSESVGTAPRTLRQRAVTINAAYLASHFAPAGKDQAGGRAAAAKSLPAKAVIELFPGETAVLMRDDVEEAFGGGYVWTGKPAGDDRGSADLIIDGGTVTGLVILHGHSFKIEAVKGGKGLHVIREVDNAAFPEGNDVVVPPKGSAAPAPAPAEEAAAAVTPTRIDILMAYTTQAKGSVTNINTELNLAISLAKTSFKNSKVPIVYRLVGSKELKGTDDSVIGFGDYLSKLTSSGVLKYKSIRLLRNTKKADLVTLFINRQDFCGLGWLGPGNSQFGFSVVAINCITNQSFAHETGHNLGLNHDRFVENNPPQSKYNYGYVNLTRKVRDVMAYNSACADKGFFCERLTFFSTPRVKANGAVIGIAAGKKNPADNARALTENRKIIAAFR